MVQLQLDLNIYYGIVSTKLDRDTQVKLMG